MRTTGAACAAAALMLGLASAAKAQNGDGDYHSLPAQSPSWFSGWFSWGKTSSVVKNSPVLAPTPGSPSEAATPTPLEASRADSDPEWKALWRRLDVCHRLMEISDKNSDDALRRRAEELEQRAWDLYHQRTNRPGSSPTRFESDEASLSKRLGGDGQKLLTPTSGGDGRMMGLRGDK